MSHVPDITAFLHDVRTRDYDRFLAACAAPSPQHEELVTLLAFYDEIAKTVDVVSDPTVGLIRLTWWREALEEISQPPAHGVRRHPVVMALATMQHHTPLNFTLLQRCITTKEQDFVPEGFAEDAALLAYLEGTSSALLQLMAEQLTGEPHTAITHPLGLAWGLLGTLRAAPQHLPKARCLLPLSRMAEQNITLDHYGSTRFAEGIQTISRALATQALESLQQAQQAYRTLPKPTRRTLAPLHVLLRLSAIYHQQMHAIDDDLLRTPLPRHHSPITLLRLWWAGITA